MNYKKLKEGEKTEMPISSQVTLNDKNWKIIKKFRFIENGKYKYTFLVECIHCGFQKEVSNSGIYKGNIKCPNCFCQGEIGKIYGCYKITEFLGYTDHKERLYKSKCIKCGHVFERRRIDDIRTPIKESCKFCNSIKDNFAYNHLLNDYKASAKSRNLKFELTNDEFYLLINSNCKYCGNSPELRIFRKGYNGECSALVNGIDRINSNIGYVANNCVSCCSKCNKMKLDYSVKDFLNHISKIYHYNKVKGSETIENTSNDES